MSLVTFIAFLLLCGCIALGVWYLRERRARTTAESQRDAARAYGASLEAANQALQQRVAVLQRYQSIVDAEAHAAAVRAQAEAGLRDAEARARAGLSQAEQAANLTRFTAQNDAARILAQAESDARRIAGEALDAARRAQELQRTVQALENTIEGYGDRYVQPTFGLLEELGEQYGFTEAGRELKAAMARVSAMAKQGTAATCDYVEANRRSTAIAFVLDAFLGKVDSILASVKQDNYGVLQQRLVDSYQLVNHLGEAFRNARILPAFRDAELEVLKWSAAVHQLRQREKEEQRALREQMREEEKARKEYERAMREAAKDEETARKALEKARGELATASEAQRAKYEARLLELTERLRLAEEKGQRALSMAQQTKSGNVYVISNVGSFGEDVLKIGMTRRLEPLDRVKELGDASVPFEFDVHAMIRCDDAPGVERQLHKFFLRHQVNKVNPRKEFFRVPVADVRKAVEQLGLQSSWSMTADCREWKESQAIEAKLQSDAAAAAQWEDQQMRAHDRVLQEELLRRNEDLELATA